MPGVFAIDPLADPRWDELVARHPRASIFHSRGWIEALSRTYGYEPVVMTTTGDGPLENGLLLCRVRTWLSRRLVSLPFSDHCEPLVDTRQDLATVLGAIRRDIESGRWRSFELRPRSSPPVGLARGSEYWLHTLDLARPASQVFSGLHASSTQRAIRRAEREGLEYEVGTSDTLLAAFYRLLRLTRRRHGIPPQPFAWFRNLVTCLHDRLAIHAASKDGLPVAAILTISFGRTMVYKYGGSDATRHNLGGMPFLFWRAILGAQSQGLAELDLGRADLDQRGLITFKQHLGATPTRLTYRVFPEGRIAPARSGTLARVVQSVVKRLPDAALDLTGRLVYRHLG